MLGWALKRLYVQGALRGLIRLLANLGDVSV